jgi:hypothetical protein
MVAHEPFIFPFHIDAELIFIISMMLAAFNSTLWQPYIISNISHHFFCLIILAGGSTSHGPFTPLRIHSMLADLLYPPLLHALPFTHLWRWASQILGGMSEIAPHAQICLSFKHTIEVFPHLSITGSPVGHGSIVKASSM